MVGGICWKNSIFQKKIFTNEQFSGKEKFQRQFSMSLVFLQGHLSEGSFSGCNFFWIQLVLDSGRCVVFRGIVLMSSVFQKTMFHGDCFLCGNIFLGVNYLDRGNFSLGSFLRDNFPGSNFPRS